MASHHHHHHQCHPSTTTPTCFCCHCSTTITSHHPPELIIHCQQQHYTHQPHHSPSPTYLQNPKPHFQHQPRRHHQNILDQGLNYDEEINQTVISSLLRRISALESSVRPPHSSSTLRHAAARTIQIHFRAFLVHRSRTLRQLKDLAFIKSALNTLKLNHSNNTRSDSRALSHKALNLLNKLDLIQGSDPMIRDAKRSINKELIRFMDYLDELSVKRHQLSTRVVKNLRIGVSGTKSGVFNSHQRVSGSNCGGPREDGERELLEKLRKRVEKMEGYSRVSEEDEDDDNVEVENENSRLYVNGKPGATRVRNGVLMKRQDGAPSKAKKSVRFAENGNVYMVYKGSNGPVSFVECHSNDGSDSVDAEEIGREIEEIGGDDEEEDEESPQISDDDDRDPGRNVVAESDNESSGHEPIENEDGSFVFSAPLPVKMEPRADLMNKKSLKITN